MVHPFTGSSRTLLFDIDGTLLLTHQGGSGAMALALEDAFALVRPCTEIEFAGRTDRSLLGELLIHNGLPDTEDHRRRLQESYVRIFPRVLQQRGGRLLPGVAELAERLATHATTRSYVMTGNLLATATVKLSHFGLHTRFRGIFGGDHDVHRVELAQRTLHALTGRYGNEVRENLIVIGDTPDDIRCGHAIGARVIAVCTGSYGRVQLEAENPESVHDDFSDVDDLFSRLVD